MLPPAVTTTSRGKTSPLRLICRPRVILALILFTFVIILLDIRSKTQAKPVYIFDKEDRPLWLDSPRTGEPLLFRVAVISHPSEVQRRQHIRDSIFSGVPSEEIQLEYRFFVGMPLEDEFGEMSDEIWKEEERYKDIVILHKPDVFERISEKRYAAMKWADSFSNASYDYFMTMDSDTFVRFKALARRLPVLFPDRHVDPRQQPIMIGRMRPFSFYWLSNVTNKSTNTREDTQIVGPEYKYPVGIGYIFSSFLVKTLLSTQPSIPHHIHYPYDDVMIGSWIAALKNYHRPEMTFRYSKHSWPWNIFSQVAHPQPLLPSPVDTLIIDDPGWQDYPGRRYDKKFESIGWNTVCIHHLQTEEIPMLRQLGEFQGEWRNSESYGKLDNSKSWQAL